MPNFNFVALLILEIVWGCAKFYRGTWPRPRPFSEFLFVRFGETVHVHPCAKYQVCSFTLFEDIFEGVPNFIRVTWRRRRPFSEILFVRFIDIVYVHPCAEFQVSSFTGLGDMKTRTFGSVFRTPWKNPWTDIHETYGQLLPPSYVLPYLAPNSDWPFLRRFVK